MNNPRLHVDTMSASDGLKIVFVAFLWALCFPLIKVGLSGGTSPILFGALRSFLAAVGLFAVAHARKEAVTRIKEHKLLLFSLGVTVFFGYVGMVLGGAKVNPGLASVVGNSHPIVATILAAIFLSEKLSPIKITGLVLGFLGVALISATSFSGETTTGFVGIGFVLIGALGTGAGNVLLKKISDSDFPILALVAQFAVAALLLFLVSIYFEGPPHLKIDVGFSIALVVLSLGATALADVLWLDLLGRHALSKLNVFIFLTPAFSLAMGIVFFEENFGVWEALGIIVILAGVFLVLERKRNVFSKTE